MKILFVENRYATRLYEAVARHLARDGHDIHWLVQNPIFAPASGTVHVLPFPRRRAPDATAFDPFLASLSRKDRGMRYFGGSAGHHEHYFRQIGQVLSHVSPRVVFGEATQFHELMTIEICARSGIPYRFPTSTRYPPGRTVFFAGDTMQPVGGCGERLTDAAAEALIRSVNTRSVVPSYMEPTRTRPWQLIGRKLTDRARISYGWLLGERFVTPSPIRKLQMNRRRQRLIKTWDRLALSLRREARPYVLYPLQMQPENNLDIWGIEWSDQAEAVRRLAVALSPLGMNLVVKPNPKSMYEITDALCGVASELPNIVPIVHGTPMNALFAEARGIVSATGTALIEAVFAGKLAATLAPDAWKGCPGIRPLSSPEHLVGYMEKLPSSIASHREAFDLISLLQASSYSGRWVDPLNAPEGLASENVASLAAAFKDQLTP